MIYFTLGIVVFLLVAAIIVLSVIMVEQRKQLRKFSKIASLDDHVKELIAESEFRKTELTTTLAELGKQKQIFQKYVEVVGVVRSVADAQEKLKKVKADLEQAVTKQRRNMRALWWLLIE